MHYHQSLIEMYASKKKMSMMPVKINGQNFSFSPGKHNGLQKAIIEEFAPRFAPNSECLYVGDTIEKDLVKKAAVKRKFVKPSFCSSLSPYVESRYNGFSFPKAESG